MPSMKVALTYNPGRHLSDYMVDSDDDDNDYLAASMASQRSVCSDAFDFLFDSQNLNPDKIQVETTLVHQWPAL